MHGPSLGVRILVLLVAVGAAENLSRVRRIALMLLKQERTAKVGIKCKRLKAGWDKAYLLRVLGI